MDLSQLLQLRVKKLSLAKQIKLIQLMNNLFKSGFHLSEIIDFLERSGLTEAYFISKMREGLLNGQSFSGILAELKFYEDIVTQLSLAESHGNVEYTLGLIEEKLIRVLNIRRKLIQVSTYPLVLLAFLIFIMARFEKLFTASTGRKQRISNLCYTESSDPLFRMPLRFACFLLPV